jgi:hypothetical protein
MIIHIVLPQIVPQIILAVFCLVCIAFLLFVLFHFSRELNHSSRARSHAQFPCSRRWWA